MGLLGKFNLIPTLNVAAICASMVFIGAVVFGVF